MGDDRLPSGGLAGAIICVTGIVGDDGQQGRAAQNPDAADLQDADPGHDLCLSRSARVRYPMFRGYPGRCCLA